MLVFSNLFVTWLIHKFRIYFPIFILKIRKEKDELGEKGWFDQVFL